MCYSCWEERERPTALPADATETVALIEQLCEMRDCGVGGPLHVVVDDFNIEDPLYWPEPGQLDYYAADVQAFARTVFDRLVSYSENERVAVLALREGWLDPTGHILVER